MNVVSKAVVAEGAMYSSSALLQKSWKCKAPL